LKNFNSAARPTAHLRRALQPVQFLQVGNSGPRGAWLAGTIEDDLDVSSQRTPYDSFGPRAQ
jgi:hypothetical protein